MSGPVQPPLTVQTIDGTTTGRPITTIKVTNGDLTVSGNIATIDTSGSGGGMTSFDLAGDSGATQSIGNGDTLSVLGGTGLASVASATDTVTLNIENTLVSGTTPDYYDALTINAQGQVTAVAAGTAPQAALPLTTTGTSGAATLVGATLNIPQYAPGTGTVTSITAGTGLDGGTITTSGTIDMADTAVTPGSYTTADITVDQQGRITAASTGSGGGGTPAGSNQQIQYNNSGSFGASSAFFWDDSDKSLIINDDLGGGGISLRVQGESGEQPAAHFQSKPTSTNATSQVLKLGAGLASGSRAAGFGPSLAFYVADAGFGGFKSGEIKTVWVDSDSNSDMVIEAAGTGNISLGNMKFDADQTIGAGQDDYVLTYDNSTGVISLEAAGGGASPGGSDGELQYNNSGTFGGLDYVKRETTGGYEGLALGSAAPGLVTTQGAYNLKLDTNTGTNSGAIEIVDGVNGAITLTPNGTGTVSLGTMIFDADQGLSASEDGYVMTYTDSTGELSLKEAAGGGGLGATPPAVATGSFLGSANKYPCFTSAPYGTSNIITTDTSADYDTNPCMRPFVLAEGGTWGGVAINVQSASTSNDLLIAVYDSDTNGMPTALKGYCDISTAATGNITQTTTLDSAGSSATISLSANTQYWCSFVAKNSSDTCTLTSVDAIALAGFGGSNMQNEYTLLRNTFTANAVETTNPPRNTQTLSDRDAPHIGIII